MAETKTRVQKNAKGYGYTYTDLAQVHEYLETQGITYYQEVKTEEGFDYIYTIPIINGEEKTPRRGCRVVEATLSGKSNPAQEHGSALTYARRYSLLMAFGLATEDDDAESLTVPKQTNQTAKTPAKKTAPAKQAEPVKKESAEMMIGKIRYQELTKLLGDENLVKETLKLNNITSMERLGITPDLEYTRIKKDIELTMASEQKQA